MPDGQEEFVPEKMESEVRDAGADITWMVRQPNGETILLSQYRADRAERLLEDAICLTSETAQELADLRDSKENWQSLAYEREFREKETRLSSRLKQYYAQTAIREQRAFEAKQVAEQEQISETHRAARRETLL